MSEYSQRTKHYRNRIKIFLKKQDNLYSPVSGFAVAGQHVAVQPSSALVGAETFAALVQHFLEGLQCVA